MTVTERKNVILAKIAEMNDQVDEETVADMKNALATLGVNADG